MKIVLLLAVIYGASASKLQFVHVPPTIHLPETADLRSNDVPVVTSQLLGLSAEVPPGWTGYGDLLSRPKAAAIFVINTPDHFTPQLTGNSFALTQTEQGLNLNSLEFDLKTFNNDVVLVDSSFAQLEAINADALAGISVDGLVKTKITPLREELENIYRIALWLEKGGMRLEKHGAPDLYVLHISGLAAALTSAGPSDPDTKAALDEVTQAIEKLSAALRAAYGDQVVVEMVTQSTTAPQDHIIVKRDTAGGNQTDTSKYNLYGFINQEYPAAFAIVGGVSIFLAIIVLFIAVGMWNMDPGKDSIIYRMTTPRLKRE